MKEISCEFLLIAHFIIFDPRDAGYKRCIPSKSHHHVWYSRNNFKKESNHRTPKRRLTQLSIHTILLIQFDKHILHFAVLLQLDHKRQKQKQTNKQNKAKQSKNKQTNKQTKPNKQNKPPQKTTTTTTKTKTKTKTKQNKTKQNKKQTNKTKQNSSTKHTKCNLRYQFPSFLLSHFYCVTYNITMRIIAPLYAASNN